MEVPERTLASPSDVDRLEVTAGCIVELELELRLVGNHDAPIRQPRGAHDPSEFPVRACAAPNGQQRLLGETPFASRSPLRLGIFGDPYPGTVAPGLRGQSWCCRAKDQRESNVRLPVHRHVLSLNLG